MREWLNRGFHGLSLADLQRALQRLFDLGDIEAFLDDDDCGFRPDDSQLEAALRKEDKQLHCGVTLQGGTRWESLASPDWSRFFADYGGWNGDSVELAAGSHERLVEIVDYSELLWDVSMDAGSLDIEIVQPWEALDWKVLPRGFFATVPYAELPIDCRSAEEAKSDKEKARPLYIELRTWAKSICGNPYV